VQKVIDNLIQLLKFLPSVELIPFGTWSAENLPHLTFHPFIVMKCKSQWEFTTS